MKTIIAIIILLALGVAVYAVAKNMQVRNNPPEDGEQVYCTMDAKLCPDGSYVGRVGPNCEFAACPASGGNNNGGGGGEGILPFDSGVNGTIMVGPTCPVERYPSDPQCADKPLSTLVAIFRSTDLVHAYILIRSDANGRFSAAMAPGNYVIGAGESTMPSCPQTNVSVEPSKYVNIIINCDSGIR